MRNPIRHLTVLLALLSAVAAAPAQPALNLVTIDLVQAYESYWKTQEKQVQFADASKNAEEQITQWQAEGKLIVDEARALQEKANNEILSQEARDSAAAELQQKSMQIRQKEEQIQQFVANTERTMQQRQKVHQELMLDEINEIVLNIGQARGATLILDTSGPTGIGVSNVLWADEGYDITAEVIARLNESKPADFELNAPSQGASSAPVN